MAWKKIYAVYILIGLLLVAGIIVALVVGLGATSNNNKVVSISVSPSSIANDTVDNTKLEINAIYAVSENMQVPSISLIDDVIPTNDIEHLEKNESNIAVVDKGTTTAVEPILAVVTEPIIESPKIIAKPSFFWKVRNEIEVPRTVSPSFGMSLGVSQDIILVGAPMDDMYGRVLGYSPSETQGLKEVQDVPFSFVGSPYQRAGTALQNNIVAAPDFALKVDRTKAQEGTLFIIDDLEGNASCRRLSTHLNDGFNIVKYGQIFCYMEPFIYVTKRKIGHQCVDVFEMKTDAELKFCQRFEDQDNLEDLFGHHIAVSKDNSRLVISDPFTNNFRIYAKQQNIWTESQIINMTVEYEDKEDLEQDMVLSVDGSKLLISSGDNEKVLVYYLADDQKYQKVQVITLDPSRYVNLGDKKLGFGTSMSLSDDGNMLAICENSDSKMVHIYSWSESLKQFVDPEEISILPSMSQIAMNTEVIWKDKDLFVCGLSEINHDGKLLWLQREQKEP